MARTPTSKKVKGYAEAAVASMAKWERKPADFYSTPYAGTVGLLNVDPPPTGVKIKEPACGDGAVSRALQAYGYEVDSSDLRYTGYGEPRVDFLKDETMHDAIITNPPFKVAAEFIRHAVTHSRYTALLLKSNYWNTENRLAVFHDHPPAGIYPLTWRLAFLADERGKNPLMDCNWYVWREGPVRFEPIPRPKKIKAIAPISLATRLLNLETEIENLVRVINGRGK